MKKSSVDINMVIIRLKHYPNVCRLCLKLPDPSTDSMFPVSLSDDLFHGTIKDYISSITFDAPDKSQLFPQQMCRACLEQLQWHAKYRTNIMNISLLMVAISELKHSSNSIPLEELFKTKREHMLDLFDELELKYDANTLAADIIHEFSKHPDVSQTTISALNKNNLKDLKNVDQSPSHIMLNAEENISINVNELTVGEEIEIVDDKALNDEKTDLPKKRKPGRPRKEIKTFRCGFSNCRQVYHEKKLYDHHRWTGHKFVCDECGQKCASQHSLNNHLARHKNEEQFQCEYCQKLYNVKEDLNNHIKQIHLVREMFRCDTCRLEFKHKVTFDAHNLTHKDAFGFPCPKCDKKFKAKRLLYSHTFRVHKEPSYTCDQCGNVFRSRFVLLDHIEATHEIRMRFICEICVEVFDEQGQLNVHKARHRSPSELECGTCLLVFNSKDQMFNHLCITYKKDYICCGKDHGHHRTYNKHQLVEHGVKVNVRVKPKDNELAAQVRAKRNRVQTCSKCDKDFSSKQAKQRHLKKCGKDSIEDS